MRKTLILICILTSGFLIFLGGCNSTPTTTKLEQLTASLDLNPDPPKAGQNTLKIKLTGANQTVIKDAAITVTYIMPAMPAMGMPEMRGSANAEIKGDLYEAPIELSMDGSWILRINVKDLGWLEYSLTTGSKGLNFKESSLQKDKAALKTEENTGGLKINAEKQQLIGVKTEFAQMINLKKTIRTVGSVAYDPELYTTLTEYSQALAVNAAQLISASLIKLEQLGIAKELADKLITKDNSLLVGSENGPIWIYGKIYENDIGLVKEGLTVKVSSKNLPGEIFTGTISSIDKVIDETTRSLKVRALVLNRNGTLKPNMYVDVKIVIPLGNKLAIPQDAVMDTGDRQIVYVDKGEGLFEPRNVTYGIRADGLVEIIKGLKTGEKIVTSGTFLIDSESRLKSTGQEHVH